MLPIEIEARRYALQAARENLAALLECGNGIGFQTDSGGLRQRSGSFVTLRNRETGALRGCRGEYSASRPLIESLIAQAIRAATDDPRFPSVRREELPCLSLRISALTTPRPIRADEIELGRHGLIVVGGERSGLLLPEVARHYGLTTAGEFVAALLRKAGLSDAQFAKGEAELHAFETIAWGEEEMG